MIRVLITGANGFVGSHILENMLQQPNIEVIAACRDKSKLVASFTGEVRQGDLRDEKYRHNLLDDIDMVCHAAAWTALWGHREDSEALYLEPSLKLIDLAASKGIKRFINVSTTSANPAESRNAFSPGIKRRFWPHLNSVINIENYMQKKASKEIQMINLRLGIFAGERYGLGLLPILLPRLKTHLVPWVSAGRTSMPIIDGRDIAQAFTQACLAKDLKPYESFNIVGPSIPNVRQVIEFIHQQYQYPKPHFSVPFCIAYPFAQLIESIDPIVPWEPLVTRSIIHLLENTDVDNQRAFERLGYQAKFDWKIAVSNQINEIIRQNNPAMKMAKQII